MRVNGCKAGRFVDDENALDESPLDAKVSVVIEPALVIFSHVGDQLSQVLIVGEVFAFHLRVFLDHAERRHVSW